jgi:hypothetical protein
LTFWDEPLKGERGKQVERSILQASSNWTNTLFASPLRAQLQERCTHVLGEYARVKMGIKSGCNEFFLLRADSQEFATLADSSNALVPVIKNSRAIVGYVLPTETPYRFLNLYEELDGLSRGIDSSGLPDALTTYIYEHGIKYPCLVCQKLAEEEHVTAPERFPHRGMCERCSYCQEHGACDRAVDRLSTQGHVPAWYTLALGEPPLIAVQCIVDTEIGVFWNAERVYLTDQFQVIDKPTNSELGWLLFLYLNSRVAHYLLEGMGLHRARYDGSFMLKLQVEHLRQLPCPDLAAITSIQRQWLFRTFDAMCALPNRNAFHLVQLRDDLDRIFLELLGFTEIEIKPLVPQLRDALEQAILFRWVKTRTRLSSRVPYNQGSNYGA